MRINCMRYVYGMRESTGKYTEVTQLLELESSSSLLPTLRDIAGSVNLRLVSQLWKLQSTEKRAKVRCNSAGHGLGKLLNAITSSTVCKAG